MLQRIVAPTGADEPFYYSIETHYGASDHEVFNDWGVQVPGIMMIDWPDRWYHTSGDHVDKTDPTQLKRVAVIGAAARLHDRQRRRRHGDEDRERDGGQRRAAHRAPAGARAGRDGRARRPRRFADAYKGAREHIEAAVINEKNTLETVNELAADKARVGGARAPRCRSRSSRPGPRNWRPSTRT